MAFDWAGFLLDLVSDVEIPIGSADDKSESNQDVTFQYGENLPYLESMLGYEMYGSNWNPPPSNNTVPAPPGQPQPGGSTPGSTGGSTTAPPPSGGLDTTAPNPVAERGRTTTVPFRWDLTPGAGQTQLPPDGTVPLPDDQAEQIGGETPLPNDPTQRIQRRQRHYGGGRSAGRGVPYMF